MATGGENDLEDVNVLGRDCEIRFIITVDKLREGWDCPFAYVLCSLRETRSATALEQIVGRVLRLPPTLATARVTELVQAVEAAEGEA